MPIILDPLYDKKANFVGWLVDYSNVFNKDLEWVAYIYTIFVWSKKIEYGLVD